MTRLLATLMLSLVAARMSVQASRPCCMPPQFTASFVKSFASEIPGNVPRTVEYTKTATDYDTQMEHYDIQFKDKPNFQFQVLVDHANFMNYYSSHGVCVFKVHFPGNVMKDRCRYCTETQYVGSSVYGVASNDLQVDLREGSTVTLSASTVSPFSDRWLITSMVNATHNSILPVFERGVFTGLGGRVHYTTEYSNFVMSITDRSVFNIPSFCPEIPASEYEATMQQIMGSNQQQTTTKNSNEDDDSQGDSSQGDSSQGDSSQGDSS